MRSGGDCPLDWVGEDTSGWPPGVPWPSWSGPQRPADCQLQVAAILDVFALAKTEKTEAVVLFDIVQQGAAVGAVGTLPRTVGPVDRRRGCALGSTAVAATLVAVFGDV